MRYGDYKIMANMLPQPFPGDPKDAQTPAGMAIMDFIKKSKLGNYSLFNLAKDPNETTDLAQSEPERLAEMQKQLLALHAEIRDEGPVYDLGGGKKTKKKKKK